MYFVYELLIKQAYFSALRGEILYERVRQASTLAPDIATNHRTSRRGLMDKALPS